MQSTIEEVSNKVPMKPHSIFRNTVIGYKNGNPVLFQNIAKGGIMNVYEVGWKETCQGETFIDNISDKVVCSLEPMEAAKYLYDYFYKVIINTKAKDFVDAHHTGIAFTRYVSNIPQIYRGDFNVTAWSDYVSSFIDDMDEFA